MCGVLLVMWNQVYECTRWERAAQRASFVSGSDAAFMAFGKGDNPAERPQVGEVGATCISFQTEFGAYIFRFFVVVVVQNVELKFKELFRLFLFKYCSFCFTIAHWSETWTLTHLFCVFQLTDRAAGSPATHKGHVREIDPSLESRPLCSVTFHFLFLEARKGLLTLSGFCDLPFPWPPRQDNTECLKQLVFCATPVEARSRRRRNWAVIFRWGLS